MLNRDRETGRIDIDAPTFPPSAASSSTSCESRRSEAVTIDDSPQPTPELGIDWQPGDLILSDGYSSQALSIEPPGTLVD